MPQDTKHNEDESKSEGHGAIHRHTKPITVLLLDNSDTWTSANDDLLAVAQALCADSNVYDVYILCKVHSPLHLHLIQKKTAPHTCIAFFSQDTLSQVALWRATLRLLWRFDKKTRMCVHTFSPSCLPLARSLWRWRHRDKKNASNKSTLVFHSAFDTPQKEHLRPREIVPAMTAIEKILCPSQYISNIWAEAGVQPQGLSVINPVCHVSPDEIVHPQTTPSSTQRFIFMAFEQLEDDAGLDVLLKAMAALWQYPDLPEWEVRVVGAGSRFDALLQEAQALGVAPRLGLFGEQPIDYMAPSAHTIVSPQTHHAGNLKALMIAWSYALPLIFTQVPASMEVANTHNALPIPPNDPQSLAAAMIACMRDKETWTRAAHLSATMTKHARTQRLQEQYMEIYQDSIARHGWPTPHARLQNTPHAKKTQKNTTTGENHEV